MKPEYITLANDEFIAQAFANLEDGEVPWVASFKGEPESRYWFGCSAIPLRTTIRAKTPVTNNYISNSTYHPSSNGSISRSGECWAGLYLVVLDDLGTKFPVKPALRLEPSCLIETSKGNFQAYLFLTEPERSKEQADVLMQGLAGLCISDAGACKVGQYGRLPTGVNGKQKHKDAGGNAWVQRTHIWEPARRYSVAQIAEAYGVDLTPKPKRPSKATNATPAHNADAYLKLLDWAGLYLGEIRNKEGGHRIICPWWKTHTDQGQTGTAYFEPSEDNNMRGGFKCQHGHCADRSINDFAHYIQGLLGLYRQKAAA